MKREEIVTEARAWLGTPWKHQAALKGIGCDCIGLVAGVALKLGSSEAQMLMSTPEYRAYGRKPDPSMLARACRELLDRIGVDDTLPGDVLLMRFNSEPQHFALVSEPGQIIHAYAQARRVVEHRVDRLWRSRIVAAYRMRGVQ